MNNIKIEEILQIRRNYSIKLFEHFNSMTNNLSEIISTIKHDGSIILQEEEKLWLSLQSKKNTLLEFDKEIAKLSRSEGILDKERVDEINKLRKKMELKILHSDKIYQKFISLLIEKEQSWKNSIYEILLHDIYLQKTIISLGQSVDNTFKDFQNYCINWRKEPIERLVKVIEDSKKIEEFSQHILADIFKLSSLQLDEEHLANLKANEIPKNCNILSKDLERFIMTKEYMDIFDKIKKSYPYVSDFFNLFKDTGFSSIRSSIRLVNNLQTTEKKLNTIIDNFYNIQEVFQEVLSNLESKKNELLQLCTDKETLTKKTCEKWVEGQYKSILFLSTEIEQKRNEFINVL